MKLSTLSILLVVASLLCVAALVALPTHDTTSQISFSTDTNTPTESGQVEPSNVNENGTDLPQPERSSNRSTLGSQLTTTTESYVVVVDGDASDYSTLLAAYGKLGTVSDDRADVTMRPTNASVVRSLEWVVSVRRQSHGTRTATGSNENISSIEADTIHRNGIQGDGVKIGVIGVGPAVSDVPYEGQIAGVRNFKDDEPIDASPDHDTAAVEQVAEIAPGAELYLTGVQSSTDFGAAMQYLIDQDVDIVLTELAYYGRPGDGSSYIARQVDTATAEGVTVVSPAGNGRLSHYESQFFDPDGDGYHNFAQDDQLNRLGGADSAVSGARGQLTFYLTWSDFGSDSVSDYDFYLYNEQTGNFVAASERAQTSGAAPVEAISYSTSEFEPLSLVVYHYAGDTNDQIEIHGPNWLYRNQYHVPEGSVVPPATASTAVSTAAYVTPEARLADYSAEGPVTNRPGISIAGYSHLPATPYDDVFTGTSGAGPYVAGTAALVEEASGGVSPAETRTILQQTADPLPQPPERTGTGLINATAAVSSVYNLQFGVSADLTEAPTQITSSEGYEVAVTVTNTGGATRTQNISYDLVDSDGLSQITSVKTDVRVASGDKNRSKFTIDGADTGRLDNGDYTHVIAVDRSTTATQNVTVVNETTVDSPLVRFDQNNDNRIDRNEAVRAIIAYNTGGTIGGRQATREQVVSVIIAYNANSRIGS
jgi:hypothetical protein